jgi:hypothetical protein
MELDCASNMGDLSISADLDDQSSERSKFVCDDRSMLIAEPVLKSNNVCEGS